MRCEDIQNLFILYLRGQLDNAQQQNVEQHLETCRRCQSEFQFDQQLMQGLSADHELPELSPDFNQLVMARAATLRDPWWNRLMVRAVKQPYLVSAAGIIFSLLLALIYVGWNWFGSSVSFFLAWLPVMPFMISLVLLIMFAIIYVNEKFIEKLIYGIDGREK
jgi:predicted anti-sigma-YlaC factor YlaD